MKNKTVDEVKAFLKKISKVFHENIEVEVEDVLGLSFLNLKSENPELLIGRSGTNLEAAQTLVSAFARKIRYSNNDLTHRLFIVDVGGYKSRSIKYNLDILKESVKKLQGSDETEVSLPPMDSYHRKICHHIVSMRWPEIITESYGEGEGRHIVLKIG